MKILICDDEEPFALQMRDLLQAHCAQKAIAAEFVTVTQPQTLSQSDFAQFDIAFLDVDMQPMNGIDVGRALRRARSDVIIIFVTNYVEYAPEGFELQAFRYLVKSQITHKLQEYLSCALEQFAQNRQVITISLQGEKIDVSTDKILYIEAKTRMVVMHLTQHARTTFEFYATISAMEENLAALGFLRIHKSYLVNMKYLSKLQCRSAVLSTGQTLSVSEKSYPVIKECFLAWRGVKKWNIS